MKIPGLREKNWQRFCSKKNLPCGRVKLHHYALDFSFYFFTIIADYSISAFALKFQLYVFNFSQRLFRLHFFRVRASGEGWNLSPRDPCRKVMHFSALAKNCSGFLKQGFASRSSGRQDRPLGSPQPCVLGEYYAWARFHISICISVCSVVFLLRFWHVESERDKFSMH